MRLTVILDHKFICTSDQQFCSLTMFGTSFWQRYLTVFEQVRVICRARPPLPDEKGFQPVQLPNVEFLPVPYYEGPAGLAKRFWSVRRFLLQNLTGTDAYILRVPQILPSLAVNILRRRRIPFGVEVVGDPWDLYAPGAEESVLRPFIRRYAYSRLRRTCHQAHASSYVTEWVLQQRYPPRPETFTTHASSVELESVRPGQRNYPAGKACGRLLFVGAMNRLYKGQDTLLDAVAICCQQYQLELSLVMVGGGQYLESLQRQARELGIAPNVRFTGPLPRGEAVQQEMEKADLFVLPSRQEGLPRSVIEAMAEGLPCIISDVGGNRELVERECQVPADDPRELANRIRELISDGRRLSDISAQNKRRAEQYVASRIQPRRELFYRAVRRSAEGSRNYS